MPVSSMYSWSTASLPRLTLSARLSRKPRPNIRHDRHHPMPVATLFLHQLQRPRCRTLNNTSGTLLELSALPIQAP